MTVEQLVREADIHTGNDLGHAVFDQVRAALANGEDRDELVRTPTSFYDRLGAEGREDDQDAIADVIDSLTGFCSPSVAL